MVLENLRKISEFRFPKRVDPLSKFHILPQLWIIIMFFAIFRVAYWSFFSGWPSDGNSSSSSSDSSCTGGTMQLLTYLWFHIGDGRRRRRWWWCGDVVIVDWDRSFRALSQCAPKNHSLFLLHLVRVHHPVAAVTFWVGTLRKGWLYLGSFFFLLQVFDPCWQCVSTTTTATASEQMAFWRLSTNRRELIF